MRFCGLSLWSRAKCVYQACPKGCLRTGYYQGHVPGESSSRARVGGVEANAGDLVRADPKHVSTSFAERQNLTLRMSSRRFTRLTNAFSKKIENHALSVTLHYMNYNFCRIHKTLRITPAMAAGVTDRLWEIGDIVKVLEDWETNQARG
jgi:hypothetical protein